MRRWSVLAARLLFLGYVFFTSAYCLLCYLPFTYQQVHLGELLPSLTRLTHLHAGLFWPAFVAGLYSVWPERKKGIARTLSLTFGGCGVLAGMALATFPLLPNLKNDAASLMWSLLALLPLPWIAAIDWFQLRGNVNWRGVEEDESARIFTTAFQSAVYAAAVSFLIVVLRIANSTNLAFTPGEWTSVLLWSVLSHLLVFFLIFALFDLGLMAASFHQQATGKFTAASGVSVGAVVLLVGLALRAVVFPPLAFGGFGSWLAAFAIAICIVSYAAGTGLRLMTAPAEGTGLGVLVSPFAELESAGAFAQPVALVMLALFAWACSVRISKLDWGFVVQKMAVMVVWSIAFAIFYNVSSRVTRYSRILAYGAGVLVLVCYTGLVVAEPRSSGPNNVPSAIGQVLENFEGYDVSFRLADQALRPPVSAQTGQNGNFYSYLAENTNIPRSVHVEPVDIRLVPQITPVTGAKPNIFFFVIDSLRRDYLAPYNRDVNFTPAIAAMAADSVVFQNAFTRYGGTGLSEPSIWVGGEMLHQQYETPFAPMNSLQKLLEANHYREWISKDNILQQIVPESANIDELDKQIGTMHYDLCTTLHELSGRLPAAGTSDPVFVYTQAQNIHVSVIDREGRSVPAGETYAAQFNAAYASRLKAMDACLGSFVEALKTQGLYDNSVIVLTSDHGDSLGENGRWGHAYTIFPEVVRIPLIVHLPTAWRGAMQNDPRAVAFLTDLTPSLYYLLGQKALARNAMFGRPLFTDTLDEQQAYETDTQLLVSSYGPVYGLLSDNGRHLYIVDGVNYRDYAYELSPDGSSQETPLSDDQRTAAQKKIRDQVDEIARFYGWQRGIEARK